MRVEGQRAFDDTTQILNAAVAGLGIALIVCRKKHLAPAQLAGRFERVRRGLVQPTSPGQVEAEHIVPRRHQIALYADARSVDGHGRAGVRVLGVCLG